MSDQAQGRGRLSPPTDRVIDVLEVVAAEPARSWTLTELATQARLTKSTCLGIVNALVERGYLARVAGGIVPGEGFHRLSGAVDIRTLVVERARPHLLGFAQRGALVTLTRARSGGLQGLDILGPLIPDQRQATLSFPYVMPVRSFVAWAAWYPDAFVEQRLLRAHEFTETGALERAREQVSEARAAGYCLLRSSRVMLRLYEVLASLQDPQVPDALRREMHGFLEEVGPLLDREPRAGEEGAVVEVYAPIFGPDSEVAAVVTVLAADPASVAGKSEREAAHAVRDAARAISAELGGEDPWQAADPDASRRTG